MQVFQTAEERYQPRSNTTYAKIDQRWLAIIVGGVALGLPVVLFLGANNPILRTCFRDSISHFYYAPFWGSAFIGALFFIGTYLLVYRGEDGEGAEARLSTFAGLAAFGVALFPTNGHGCDGSSFLARALLTFAETDGVLGVMPPPVADGVPALTPYFQLTVWSGAMHYACAALLFGFLTWFALYVFTAVEPHQRNADGSLKQSKINRNRVYHICGGVMIIAMLALVLYAVLGLLLTAEQLKWWTNANLTFWAEALALCAFGISWMVKGRFHEKIKKVPTAQP